MLEDCLHSDARAVIDEMAQALAADPKRSDDAVWIGLYRAQLHDLCSARASFINGSNFRADGRSEATV